MKQTAVEWLVEYFKTYVDMKKHIEEIEQAKEIEKQQQGYSEEVVLYILKTFLYNSQMGEDVEDVKLWFEQFKK